MSDSDRDRAEAAKLPEHDVIAVIYRQHADIKDALTALQDSKGDDRRQQFQAVKTFIKAHETAEQDLIRPVVATTTSSSEANARNGEEGKADQAIVALTALDVDSDEFDAKLAEFVKAVGDHAEAEEKEEFPLINSARTAEERKALGLAFVAQVGDAANL